MSEETTRTNKLLERIINILETARLDVVKTVNSKMVIAYWMIGKEVVLEMQHGDERAGYGNELIETLSQNLTERFGKGFSTTNLWYFRQFYIVYSTRIPKILHIPCGESEIAEILHKPCGESAIGSSSKIGFSSLLSWSHYRELLQVKNNDERMFYEIEAGNEQWSVSQLKRQINTHLFYRLLKSKDKTAALKLASEGQALHQPIDSIKDPYILDFLNLPELPILHESNLEKAIIENIQDFLLELGKGFAFVARQKRIATETKYFYIDLVFYNYFLKCFLLIDLKMGELTHQDIGQMEMYVKMFDDIQKPPEDNPTVGLILCAQKDKTIAKYSVLNDRKQIFASQYMLYLPEEKELEKQLQIDMQKAETYKGNANE